MEAALSGMSYQVQLRQLLATTAVALFIACDPSRVAGQPDRSDLDYFPSREYAVIFRNWDIVPHERLASMLHTDLKTLRQAGEALGLDQPPRLSPPEVRRNVEMVLRRNWWLLPRSQIEGLLGYTAQALDEFLGKEIFLRALLAEAPPGNTEARLTPPDAQMRQRLRWFHDHLRRHLTAVADTPEAARLAFITRSEER